MNRADELSRFEAGERFENASVPVRGSELEVTVENGPDGCSVVPVSVPHARRLDLVHSETDLLMAQLTEDPEMTGFTVPGVGMVETGKSRIQSAIARNQNREQLIWFRIDSQNMTAAMGDRIVVRRDLLESEYICRECRGKGHTDQICGACDGKQQRDGVLCTHCRVLGFENEKPRPSGFRKCEACQGSGWRNGIIIPEVAQGKPVTGVIVSLGPETKWLKLGDRVMHSAYAGNTVHTRQETYTYMRELEVISLLRDMK